MIRPILFLTISGALLVACAKSEPPLTSEAMKEIVKKGNDQLGYFFIKGDADSLSLMYTEGAKLCPNGTDFVTGRPEIRDFWKEDMKSTKTHEMRTETLTINGNKEVLYETGRTFLRMTYLDSTFNLSVKYCNVWALQPDGTYKLDVDIANRDGE
jgi:ketosteroid isomerase-like protein